MRAVVVARIILSIVIVPKMPRHKPGPRCVRHCTHTHQKDSPCPRVVRRPTTRKGGLSEGSQGLLQPGFLLRTGGSFEDGTIQQDQGGEGLQPCCLPGAGERKHQPPSSISQPRPMGCNRLLQLFPVSSIKLSIKALSLDSNLKYPAPEDELINIKAICLREAHDSQIVLPFHQTPLPGSSALDLAVRAETAALLTCCA